MESKIPKRQWLERIQQKGLKLTHSRKDILEILLSESGPWTLKTLTDKLKEPGSETSRLEQVSVNSEMIHESTVYRVLTSFAKAGIVEEFKIPGGRQMAYTLNTGHTEHHHHHHIVCEKCGQVNHIDVCLPETMVVKVEKLSGYTITRHELEFSGVCGDCSST